MSNDQWIRKVSLTVESSTEVLDLSSAHIKFSVKNADVETPNNASIRIYNLSKETVNRLTSGGEFTNVTLQAGYFNGNYGKLFVGQIRQYRKGRENATDSYLDILASDGDVFYNQGFVNESVAKNTSRLDTLNRIADANKMPLSAVGIVGDSQHLVIPRGSVQFGMARARFRDVATTMDQAWSIQDGVLVLHNNTGYLGNEAVVLNAVTGLVGVPEQTNEGIQAVCLLNSRVRIGGLVQINNDDINQLMQAQKSSANLAYNSWSNLQENAALSGSGVYQAFVVEHEGDTRGNAWYTSLTCLATDQTAGLVPGGV